MEDYKGQRYTKTESFPTNDFEEIFFCAWKLNRDAKEYKDKMWGNGIIISDTEALAKAVEIYGAPTIGKKQIQGLSNK